MSSLQLLEIAVCNVVAAPVRNSVELDTVGEFHVVLIFEPLSFLLPFLFLELITGECVFPLLDVTVIAELVVSLTGGFSLIPSPFAGASRAPAVVDG